MSSVEDAINFIGSYPAWAKISFLILLGGAIGVAFLAPRSTAAPADSKAQGLALFTVLGVDDYYRGKGNLAVRVAAIVNGKTYTYPSLGGVDWVEVGPAMAPQTFKIPASATYEIRMEVDVKNGPRFVSQRTLQVDSIPFTGSYSVFATKRDEAGVSRGSAPGINVRFEIDTAK